LRLAEDLVAKGFFHQILTFKSYTIYCETLKQMFNELLQMT